MDQRHYDWIERNVVGLGYEFVHVEWVGRSGLVRVYIDKPDGVGLEDCAAVSEQLSRSMTVEGIRYERLEISSPGLDRPLVKERDFLRFVGQRAKLVLRVPLNGRKNFSGTISAVSGGSVRLEMDGGAVQLDLSNVDKARLIPEL